MAALEEDVEDLDVVVQYLKKRFGYIIDLVVGHSRGSVIAIRWLCTSPEGSQARGFVNVSGRYRMEASKLQDRQDKMRADHVLEDLEDPLSAFDSLIYFRSLTIS